MNHGKRKRTDIRHELNVLRQCRKESVPDALPLERLMNTLKVVNRQLWSIEDELCEHECDQKILMTSS